jgi:hypothetical protein
VVLDGIVCSPLQQLGQGCPLIGVYLLSLQHKAGKDIPVAGFPSNEGLRMMETSPQTSRSI